MSVRWLITGPYVMQINKLCYVSSRCSWMIAMCVAVFYIKRCRRCDASLLWRHNGRDGVSNHHPNDYSGADQIKHQSSASLALVWGIHRWPVNSPHQGPVTRQMFPFDDVHMLTCLYVWGRKDDRDHPPLFSNGYREQSKTFVSRRHVIRMSS